MTKQTAKEYIKKIMEIHRKEEEENTNYQKSEVSKIRWMSLDEASKIIRPYNLERIELLKNIEEQANKDAMSLDEVQKQQLTVSDAIKSHTASMNNILI